MTNACGRLAGKTVQLWGTELCGDLDCLLDTCPEFINPIRQTSDAALTGIPVPRGQVVKNKT